MQHGAMVENEIQYLSWKAFRRMAPSILRLEMSRLGVLMDAAGSDLDLRNALAAARFELKRFGEVLEDATPTTAEARCGPPLQAALMTLALATEGQPAPTAETLRYVLNRLTYLHDRLALIY